VEKTVREVNNRLGRMMKGLKILVLGVAFKKDVDDARNSSADKIIRRFESLGARVVYHDPWVNSFKVGSKVYKSVSLSSREARAADLVLIHTDHSNVDVAPVVARARLVIDTRNATRRLGRRSNVVKI
jgi:UDP-N-acetyl-D-glucosamine dehydrogenase